MALEVSGRSSSILEGSGLIYGGALKVFGTLWRALEVSGGLWRALECSCELLRGLEDS